MNKIERRARRLLMMDDVMRCITDEENGVFDWWLEEGLPDGSTYEDCLEYAEDDEWYKEICVGWAEHISRLIAEGEWSDRGYTLELFNTDKAEL